MTGDLLYQIPLKVPVTKDVSLLVPVPTRPYSVGIIDGEKGTIMDIRAK